MTKFHETLFLFGAKFTYELKGEGIIKIIFMAKSNIEAYNIFFKEGKKMFENDIENIIDIDEKGEDLKGIGYKFQELGRIFLNDYVIGRNKGMELPNLVFYIKSSDVSGMPMPLRIFDYTERTSHINYNYTCSIRQ